MPDSSQKVQCCVGLVINLRSSLLRHFYLICDTFQASTALCLNKAKAAQAHPSGHILASDSSWNRPVSKKGYSN